jgi:hypothetical protein
VILIAWIFLVWLWISTAQPVMIVVLGVTLIFQLVDAYKTAQQWNARHGIIS